MLDKYYNAPALQSAVREATTRIPDFWRGFHAFCAARGRFGLSEALERRFQDLDAYLSPHGSVRNRLRYAWLKLGLGGARLCPTAAWREPIPESAALVEGARDAAHSRVVLARLDRDYLFAYGRTSECRAAVAVYALR